MLIQEADSRGKAVSPSTNAKKEASSPSKNSSMMTRDPAEPKEASSEVIATTKPFPADNIHQL